MIHEHSSSTCASMSALGYSCSTSRSAGQAPSVLTLYEHAEMKLNHRDVWGHFAPMFHLVDVFAIYAITLVGGRHAVLPSFSAQDALLMIGRCLILTSQHFMNHFSCFHALASFDFCFVIYCDPEQPHVHTVLLLKSVHTVAWHLVTALEPLFSQWHHFKQAASTAIPTICCLWCI